MGVILVKAKESTETLTLRIPTSIKLQIEMAAHKDGRTLNSWVNKILKEYFEGVKNKG
jgi:predicted HicB family RNase H-like nuclease